jgi:hypothetical protein
VGGDGVTDGDNGNIGGGTWDGKGDVEEDLEQELELIYDPTLGVYFDPRTNQFFMRDVPA